MSSWSNKEKMQLALFVGGGAGILLLLHKALWWLCYFTVKLHPEFSQYLG